MIFNYLLNEHTFVCGGAINNGGNILNWLIKSFLDKKSPLPADHECVFSEIATVQGRQFALAVLALFIWRKGAASGILEVPCIF